MSQSNHIQVSQSLQLRLPSTTDSDSQAATEADFAVLRHVAAAILDALVDTGGIVFVVHKPSEGVREEWRDRGIQTKPRGTVVFGMSRPNVLCLWRNAEPEIRRWLKQPPGENDIKIVLTVGDATRVLTWTMDGKGTRLRLEPLSMDRRRSS